MKISSSKRHIIFKTIKIGLTLSIVYFLYSTYGWMMFEKYQLEGNIKGIDAFVDKDLGLDKKCELAYNYEKSWIGAEKKYCLSMALFSFLTLIGIKILRRTNEDGLSN